ncbi:MAG: malto-oligosyltrehalose synthase [Frankiaceae bacterium]|jgi:(1->4)-alpha-D-glucan 1-alpha-D-glucosylmutase|nr:malto-oligosyltrehalose synthase [Frankiaceae bacterium]
MIPAPTGSYRLQLSPDFPLERAAEIVGYLSDLGASHVYLSPLLRAAAGSRHGYDVVSHDEVDPAIGGEAGRRALVGAAREQGLAVLLDIVPNHMGVADARQNAPWRDVLRNGPASRFASWFDIDWSLGAVLLPILPDGAYLDGELRIDGDELVYYEHRFPIAEGTGAPGDAPAAVHARQHYRLVGWREADVAQNYRRFFAITALAGLRVEAPEVFEATHRLFLRWIADGEAHGLRVDHPDGLADPAGYLRRLADAAPGAWLVVEKILQPGESLPADWPVHGSTGYDALGEIAQVMTDPLGAPALEELNGARASPMSWAQHVEAGKRQAATTILRAEILRLARLAPQLEHAAELLIELAVALPVYRGYRVGAADPPPGGDDPLAAAAAAARIRRPELIGELEPLLARLGDGADELCVRFQQTTGAVMAKGVEDTALYRYPRLTSLNEVGADPGRLGATLEQFHAAAARRQRTAPLGMTALSTHDTKRSEDVRARITVLSEVPTQWAALLARLERGARTADPGFDHLLWQTLLGIGGPRPGTRQRMLAYALKAAREANVRTGWTRPDPRFEDQARALVCAAYDDPAVRDPLAAFAARIEPHALSNALSQKLIQLAMPGVPDVYQGTELLDDSLVDPDNRRGVDFARRAALLRRLDRDGAPPPLADPDAAKLWLTSRVLRARRDHPERFVGYAPLLAAGAAAEHLVAFDRGGAIGLATRFPARLRRDGGWRATTATLPPGEWADALSGRRWAGQVEVGAVLADYPAALLLGEPAAR